MNDELERLQEEIRRRKDTDLIAWNRLFNRLYYETHIATQRRKQNEGDLQEPLRTR